MDVTHPAFPEEVIGFYGLEQGVPLGTGSWLDVGDRLSFTISGSTFRLDADAPVFPVEQIGVYVTDDGVPVGTGTTLDFAGAITDVSISGTVARIFITGVAPNYPEEVIGVYVTDEGVPLGTGTRLDFVGAGVEASISGTTVLVEIGGPQAPGADQIGMYGLDDGSPLGTGTWLDAGDYLDASISGTTLRLDVNLPPEPVDQIGMYVLEDGVPLGTGTWLDARNRITATISGTVVALDIENPTFPEEEIGVYGLDDGVPLGTGSWLEAGDDLNATLSGTVLRLDVVHPAFPEEVIGMYVLDEGIPLGTGTWIDFVGGGVTATLSGTTATITIPQNTLPPVTGTVVMLNEGWVSGSFPQIDVAGEWIDLGVSGSRATLLVPARALDELSDVDISGVQDWDFLRLDFATSRWINTPLPPAAYTGSVVVYDEGIFLDAFKELRFIGGGVDAFDSGSYAAISIPAPTFPEEVIGVYGLDSGIPLGTGAWLDFRNNLTATISGSVITIDGQAGGGGGGAGVMIWDEGVPQQTGTTLNFVGELVTATVSGTVAQIEITAGDGGLATYLLVGVPEALDSITGAYWRTPGGTEYASGSLNAFLDGISQVKGDAFSEQYPVSGTYQYLEVPPTGTLHEVKFGVPVSIIGPQGPAGADGEGGFGVYGIDDGVPLGTGTWIDFGFYLDASISGTTLRVNATHPPFPEEEIGFYALEDGVPLGTGTWLDVQGRLTASLSGTTVALGVDNPTFPAEVIGVYGLDDGVPLGTGTWLDFRNNLTATISGSVITIDGQAGGGGGIGGIMVWDEGFPLQTGTIFNFVGDGVTATISGTVANISIPGGGAPGALVSGSTYVRAGNPDPLDTQTGGYWKVPDPEYATGTLSVSINGVWQQPTIDYQEQYPASGTFTMLAGLETGSLLSAIWGVPAFGGAGGTLPDYDVLWSPYAPPITGSSYDDEFDDNDPTGTLWTVFDPAGNLNYEMTPQGFLRMTAGATGQIMGFMQNLPSNGSGTFSIIARWNHFGDHTGDHKAGIMMLEDGVSNPSTSDIRTYILGEGGFGHSIQIERYSSYTTFAGSDYNETQSHATDWQWARVRRDSSGNIYYDVSQDGYMWQQINSTAEAFLAKQMGIFVKPGNTSHPVHFHFFRFVEGIDDRDIPVAGRKVRLYKDE